MTTDLYCLMGNPVEHSKSPWIHARYAELTGQDLHYTKRLLPLDGFTSGVNAFRAEGGRGCNVTVPFKFEAPALATQLTPRARLAQASNTLRFDGDAVLADNTDGVGLVNDIGVCNYSIEQIEELVYRTGDLPAVTQVEWSPFGHSPSMLDFCHDNEIVIQAWSPLTRAQRLNDNKLCAMAARYGKSPAQLLLRWNLQLGVVALPKANHAQHQRENLNIFDFEISQTDMSKLRTLNEHYSALGKLPYV